MKFIIILFLSIAVAITCYIIFLRLRYKFIALFNIKWVAEYFWYKGKKRMVFNYKGRNLEGLSSDWYESGQIASESNYKNGKIHGLATEWYESGNKKIEANFKDGQPDGLATEWSESGNKIIEVNFKDGQPDELATEWSESDQAKLLGTLRKWANLEHGVSFDPVYSNRRKS